MEHFPFMNSQPLVELYVKIPHCCFKYTDSKKEHCGGIALLIMKIEIRVEMIWMDFIFLI